MGNIKLSGTYSYLDLGVVINSDLSWSEHVVHVTKKANRMLFLLSKTFTKVTPVTFSKL